MSLDAYEALVALARRQQGEGRYRESEESLNRALTLRPGSDLARVGLAYALLARGAFAQAWPLLEARAGAAPDLVPPVTASYPEWRGEPLAGKSILVWVEQGFGDQIMMARFVAALRAQGASVTLGCRTALAALFAPLADRLIAIDAGGSVEVPRHDYWTRYFSLPGRLGVTLETLPGAPYLAAPADRRERWSGWSGVGLAWEASATGAAARSKSLPEPDVRALLGLGLRSLSPQDTGARDFADTAAILERLDLVVSIDTAVAHLAGALGRPVWILLPYAADWRWMTGRTDSPWYPTARLFRQPAPGQWAPVAAQVREALAAWRS
ncbi:tetratricopeptide repeat protein [Phenylobacterium zucineum]|uniref:tetratricopeptide repeat protein n=1 Tax=Phenylobacterium zucineum TaxID=284016 RepID=UPI000309E334|nr:tetratricopeptide repeat protein [Phenylobacterium zucineum]